MFISQETYHAFVTKISLPILYEERVTLYCKNYMKHIVWEEFRVAVC
jgi:hypothetical protein